jgi:hypothetical protein
LSRSWCGFSLFSLEAAKTDGEIDAGLDEFNFHFSGFGPAKEPLDHFNKRFCDVVGAFPSFLFPLPFPLISFARLRTSCFLLTLAGVSQSSNFPAKATHLVLADLDHDPNADLDSLAAGNQKIAVARERGIEIVSQRWVRRMIKEKAAEVAAVKEEEEQGKKGKKGKGEGRTVREITNELDERERLQGLEESLRGPLSECVVFFSTKIEVRFSPFLPHLFIPSSILTSLPPSSRRPTGNTWLRPSKTSVASSLANTPLPSLTSFTKARERRARTARTSSRRRGTGR